MSRHRIEHRRPSSVRNIAVLVGFAGALLLPALALAQSVPNVLGHYRGFAQSSIDSSIRTMELTVDRQNGTDFSGTMLLGTLRIAVRGKVDEELLKWREAVEDGAIQEARVNGSIVIIGGGGALVLTTYKVTQVRGGPADHGVAKLLRGFTAPPDAVVPDITGDWSGTAMSGLTGEQMDVSLDIANQLGTSVGGGLLLSSNGQGMGCGGTVTVDLDGPPSGHPIGRLVLMCVSAQGWLLIGGQLPPDSILPPGSTFDATHIQDFATRVVDFGRFLVTRAR